MVNKYKRSPRKTKKNSSLKTGVLVYDIQSTPDGMELEKLMYIQRMTGVVLWESTKGGKEPKLLGRRFKRFKIKEIMK